MTNAYINHEWRKALVADGIMVEGQSERELALALLHRLWGQAQANPGYIKAYWMALESLMLQGLAKAE